MKSIDEIVDLDKNCPFYTLIESFINFFTEVGEEKGLVLSDNERKELISRVPKEPELAKWKWTPRHEWHEDVEKMKIISIGR